MRKFTIGEEVYFNDDTWTVYDPYFPYDSRYGAYASFSFIAAIHMGSGIWLFKYVEKGFRTYRETAFVHRAELEDDEFTDWALQVAKGLR